MQKLVHFLMWVLMVVLLTGAVVGGTLWYAYDKTEQSEMQMTTPLLQESGLALTQSVWQEPVVGGLLYKAFEGETAQSVDLGVFTTSKLTLTTGSYGASAWAVYQDGIRVLSGNAADGALTHELTFTENGDYTLEVTTVVAQKDNAAYGSQTYQASFTLEVEPTVSLSSTTPLQGDVIAVVVSDVLDDSVPTLENTLSLAEFTKVGDDYVAYIGVAYNREPDTYEITVQCGTLDETLSVQVIHRDFNTQNMYMDSEVADSTNNDANGAIEWQTEVWPLFEIADDTTYWQNGFIWPHEGDINSEFGLFRYTYYTDGTTSTSRHTGIDIDGETGDVVVAPNAGRVVLAMDLIYTGYTVVIEHGNGVKSFFYHMDSLCVEVDDLVEQGQQIGTVGSTGYSTGPHLHYEVKIGNQSVDPIQILNGTSGLYFAG